MAAAGANQCYPTPGNACHPICRAELVELLSSQPWGDKSQRYFLNREQEYIGGLQVGAGVRLRPPPRAGTASCPAAGNRPT